MEENRMEKNCPCCDKHCPVEELRCGRGRKHFGAEQQEASENGHGRDRRRDREHFGREDGRPGPEGRTEERMLVLLRECGHFLHHNVGPKADVQPLVDALTPEERAELEALLQKCLEAWRGQDE
ncbi:MAG: hypothetical protein ACI4V1_08335 [Eubacteriales bacterium]